MVIFTDLVFNMATQDDVEGARLRLSGWCGWAFRSASADPADDFG
jgi:hypothetical protein